MEKVKLEHEEMSTQLRSKHSAEVKVNFGIFELKLELRYMIC